MAGDKNTLPEEITAENLPAKFAELQGIVANLEKLIGEQNGTIKKQNETISLQNDKIEDLHELISTTNTGASAPAGKEVLPTIPTEPVEYKKKKYKWNVAAFSLPGDPTKYTAAEASVTEDLIAKILKIDGQKILQELI